MNTKELQALVNPSFTIAKGLLNLLISGGDPNAKKLAPYLNLAELSKSSKQHNVSPEMMHSFLIGQMVKFEMYNTIALNSGKQTIIDLPCGYVTRCFNVADNGQKYYGLDLPIVIDEMKDLTSKIITEKQKDLISFNAVDATNYHSMREALKDVKEEVCIITEGLLVYLSDSELINMCQAIHKLLSEFGGFWITADVSPINRIFPFTYNIIHQGDKEKVFSLMEKAGSNMSNVQTRTNSLLANGPEKAKEFLEKQGFIIKEEPITKYIDKIKWAPADKEEELKKAYSSINIWTLTIDKKDEVFNEDTTKFILESEFVDGILSVKIEGRLDTLTSPELLKKFKETGGVKGIKIYVYKMTFISSAGIRVLEMKTSKLENKDIMEIYGAKDDIKEILIKGGFEKNIK